jgi:mannose-1-phosphate guanylyltransferase
VKAFILAAGNGTRLRPLTDCLPKCLLPIRGVPMLEIWLAQCRRAGITEVLINTHAHANAVRRYLAQHQNGLRIKVFDEPELLGSGGTLAANRDWAISEACFWVLYADVLTNMDMRTMLHFHLSQNPTATIGLYQVPDPGRCGIVTLDAQARVTRFVEKPAHPTSNLAFSGVLLATPALLDAIPDERPIDLGGSVLPCLTGRLAGYESNAYTLDIGTLSNYQHAQTTWPGLPAEERQCFAA